jgi:polyisoprenoid-binding protein YceI
MRKLYLFLLVTMAGNAVHAQEKYFTKSGTITIDATTNASLETVHAVNRTASAVLDTKTGNMLFVVLMKGFEFHKALMQEHFNENYVESDKFPKAEFKGQVENISSVDFSKDGTYNVTVKGTLSIHGKTNAVETKGSLQVTNGKIVANSNFNVLLKDYNISIPSLVSDKVSKTANIIIDCTLDRFKG